MVVQHLTEMVIQVNKDGMTVLLVEQDIQVALDIANRGYVLESGHIVFSGPSETLIKDDHVRRAYLGL